MAEATEIQTEKSKRRHAKASVLLLVSCFLFIFVLPVFEFETIIPSVIVFSAIIFLSAYSISRRLVMIGLVIILIEVLTKALDLIYLKYLTEITSNLFIIFIVGMVIRELLTRKNITVYSLIDALNGYLLMGIMFISLVAFCDLHMVGAYNDAGATDMEMVYYTFITLTTAGYGDITPQLPVTQSLSMIMAVIGQFYVAVIVAILVGKYSSKIATAN